MSVAVIAEAGVNHNGDLGRALVLVDAAAEAGADMVKFQSFVADELASRQIPKCDYQRAATDADETQHAMLKRLELDRAAHERLLARCGERKIRFLSTPFDLPSLRLLTEQLGLDLIKLPSGEITNAPLLLAAARSGARIILSTGMSDLDDVRRALGVLAFGYLDQGQRPGADSFAAAFADAQGRAALAGKVTLLHCTTEYPAPFEDVNLRAMNTLREAFALPVGLSDHSPGINVAIAAAARGAAVIEKHFTLDRSLPGPDHKASLEPGELKAMVEGIRQVERALGDGRKAPAPSEIKNIAAVRKCLVARRAIRAGERFGEDNLAVKRADGTLAPDRYWDWLGRIATRAYAEDEAIEP
ncbi:MAG: N-acetylneuraminate synthase [Alphaproteobacteria bacterium]|nr:N-acetylneuraminate synthase [Alphaproteobacteria bacterium]MBM3732150.1 N-acetylneuraminate synthase [Acidimicrobiia bacterium]